MVPRLSLPAITSAFDSGKRTRNNLDEEGFPLARNLSDIDFVLADKLIDAGALSERANENTTRRPAGAAMSDCRRNRGNASNIGLQIANGADHAGIVAGINAEARRLPGMRQNKVSGMPRGFDVALLPESIGACGKSQDANQSEMARAIRAKTVSHGWNLTTTQRTLPFEISPLSATQTVLSFE